MAQMGYRTPWSFSVVLLAIVAASVLLQSQPFARAAGPARPPNTAAPGPSDLPGMMPSWFKPDVIEGNLLDLLKQWRLARGDVKGAARVDNLRKWFSLFGLYRGLPALGLDLFRHRGLATEIAQDWTKMVERLAATPGGKGAAGLVARGREVPELLAVNREAVLEWVRQSLRKARKAFKGGAVSRLLHDIYTEVTTDQHFVSDVMKAAEALGWRAEATVSIRGGEGWLPEQLTELAQQVFEIVREELFPEKPHRGFFSFLGGAFRQREAPAPAQGLGGKKAEL